MLILWFERRGNAAKKAKASLWLRKLKVVFLQSREELPVFKRCHSSAVLNLNNSLNIEIRKKNVRTFWFLINNHQLQSLEITRKKFSSVGFSYKDVV